MAYYIDLASISIDIYLHLCVFSYSQNDKSKGNELVLQCQIMVS